MEIEIKEGMASKYFVTDVDRGAACLDRPFIMISKTKSSIKMLAVAYEKIFNSSVKNSIMGAFIKKADVSAIEIFLTDLAEKQKSSNPVLGIMNPFFLISNGIEKKCLVALKVLKLRAFGKVLALNYSSDISEDSICNLETELKDLQVYKDEMTAFYLKPKQLGVVSSLHKTIVSTEASAKDVLKSHLEINEKISNQPLGNNMDIFLDEGIYR